jgi:hypothetical protein
MGAKSAIRGWLNHTMTRKEVLPAYLALTAGAVLAFWQFDSIHTNRTEDIATQAATSEEVLERALRDGCERANEARGVWLATADFIEGIVETRSGELFVEFIREQNPLRDCEAEAEERRRDLYNGFYIRD